ncbi:MAG TPA: sulfotransferase family 2 domain-containing protein [Woeseiaceae bacterium]|nr:sulfotransferase family 2 domain-containing protein [Woeseiaceae bacterium]
MRDESKSSPSDEDVFRSKRLLAFCHIEKAAGTSLVHILRHLFFLQYADVRPMHSKENYYFTRRDLETVRAINPFLRAIGGHSLVPHGDLQSAVSELAFITQIRDPVRRAVSQYRYWVNQRIDVSGPDSFLQHPLSRNFQVKKLAGCEDLDRAKQLLRRHFLLAGTVERFNEFLVLLAGKLRLPLELFTYRRRNVNPVPNTLPVSDEFVEGLRRRNQLDQELYDWVSGELFDGYVAQHPGDFGADLSRFNELQGESREPRIKPIIDFAYRSAWLTPVSGWIRVSNGLPYRGSYSIE